MITSRNLEQHFSHHEVNDEQQAGLLAVREHALALAKVILQRVPDGADQQAAIRKVREAMMTANAGISCGEFKPFSFDLKKPLG